jgi:hypothetical protein
MLSGISNSKWKWVKKLGQHHQLLFTGAEKDSSWQAVYAKSVEKNTYEPL